MSGPQLVTVVVPVRDERRHLPAQLRALAAQTYEGAWEVVIVDDGSRDGSGDVARSFASALPGLRVVTTPPRGINHARNVGVAAARGDVVAFCDADDVAAPGWLAALVAALEPGVDLVGGELEQEALNGPVQQSWRRKTRWTEKLKGDSSFVEYVPGGNCAMRTRVARELRWDERFLFGSSDAEFSWRAQRLGLRFAVANDAVIHLRYAETVRELVRQFYGYGAGEPLLYRRERAHGWPRSDTREALREWATLVRELHHLVRAPTHRGWWVRRAALRAGRLVGSVRARVLYL